MSCKEGAQRLALYLDGTLDHDTRRRFELHLTSCAECRESLDLWTRLDALPEPAPSPALRRGFERALAAELSPRVPAAAVPWFAWAAAAMVLVGAGWLIGRQQAVTPPPSELTALRQEVGSLRSMVTMSLLAQDSASARLKGISYAERLHTGSQDVTGALVAALRFDSNVNVRLAACEALRSYRADASVRRAFVDALGAEESPMVKVTLIDTLADFGERDSVRPLLRLRSSGDENSVVRERAARALDQMKSRGIQWE